MLFNINLVIAVISAVALSLDIQNVITIKEGLPGNEVRTVYSDSGGAMWLGIRDAGLVKYNVNESNFTQEQYDLVDKGILDVQEDSKGNIWVGSVGMVYTYDGVSYDSVLLEDIGLNARLVFSVFEDNQANIWLATAGGAAKYDGISWTTYTTKNGLKHNVVHDISQDDNGRYWFATRKGGVNIYDGEKWEYVYPERNCRKLKKDDQGNMWVGTSSGLLKYDRSKWTEYELDKVTLPMFQGAKGYVWCVSQEQDIIRIPLNSQKGIIRYLDPTKSESLFHIVSNNGAIWAGTDRGVVILD